MAKYNPEDFLALLLVSIPVSVFAGLGWVAHKLVTEKGPLGKLFLLGGFGLAFFVSWVVTTWLLSTGMAPEAAAPVGAVLGASGEIGFRAALNRAKGRFNDGG
jgi:uncharacterized membrane protein YeaQ/YmgE (transglycosylase-associated protein family)